MQRYVNMINYDYIYDYKLCTVDRIQRCSTDNSWSWFSYDQGEMASWNDHVLFYQSGGCMQEIEVTAFSRSIPEVSDPVHRDFYFSSRRILAFLLLPFPRCLNVIVLSLFLDVSSLLHLVWFSCDMLNSSVLTKILWTSCVGLVVSIRLFVGERKALLTGAAFRGECFLGVPQSLGAAISSLSSQIGTEEMNKFAPS